MANLTENRPSQETPGKVRRCPVKASTKTYQGGMAGIDSNGWAGPLAPGSARSVGYFTEEIDNSTGANGDKTVEVESAIRPMDNDGTNPVAKQHIGGPCYVVDDHTVGSSATSTIVAGTVWDIDAAGKIWVKIPV